MLEEPSQRGKLGGDRSSCWVADGEHLQHRGLPKKEQAAASSRYTEKATCPSGGWKARRKEMQRARGTIFYRPVYRISPFLQAKEQGVSSA